MSLIASPFLT
jgi:hypothetical protein